MTSPPKQNALLKKKRKTRRNEPAALLLLLPMWKTVAKLSLSHYPTPHARVHLHGVMVVKQSKKVHQRQKKERKAKKKPEDLQEMPLFQVIFTSAALLNRWTRNTNAVAVLVLRILRTNPVRAPAKVKRRFSAAIISHTVGIGLNRSSLRVSNIRSDWHYTIPGGRGQPSRVALFFFYLSGLTRLKFTLAHLFSIAQHLLSHHASE
ncbi:hypothetical protein CEXT_613841 [Caerostris extrusa]|uniref:Uncharacterized protein n=1 Tax=Caerostris extrusa TaxID=172846 RepID=A0AAV4NEY8_CAEEX|nr:hypothetical protein CEXT_613841 [Caerostris extrusa]